MKTNYKRIILFIFPIIILSIISILNLYYAPNLSSIYEGLLKKQIIWYIISIIVFIIILIIKPNFIINNSLYIYLFNVFLLLLVLFIGNKVNGSRAWFKIGLFSFQPSEFMKLSLMLFLTHLISNTSIESKKDNWILILEIIIAFLIPSILTFLEPDTGAVIMYFFITLGALLFSKIDKKYILMLFGIGIALIIVLGGLYYFNKDLFINIFGSSTYYRIERITGFTDGNGMQIQNALTTIGSAKFFNIPKNAFNLYFPEAATDFMFTLIINNFGIFMSIIAIVCYLILDILLIRMIYNSHDERISLLTGSFLLMFLYQQIQNIFMNLGLLPIIGIPLPFLSYGGSSMILFFASIAIIIKLETDKKKYS